MPRIGHATASPSLALIKYWGKLSAKKNLPATSSLALTLSGLETVTTARFAPSDSVTVNGAAQDMQRYAAFLDGLKHELGVTEGVAVDSANNFPTAAGLASSSSGFAAFAGALSALAGRDTPPEELSRLARIGSGSATRSVYGGFTVFEAGSEAARPLRDEGFWPDIRVLLCAVSEAKKPVSSRVAMELSRTTSPYYGEWLRSSEALYREAISVLETRDLPKLGPLIRASYLRMFSTMFTSAPPVIYWLPESLALVKLCEELRTQGVSVWETMDAGPQVKLFCLGRDLETVREAVEKRVPSCRTFSASPGGPLCAWATENDQ